MGRFGPAVKRLAGDQTDVGLIPLHLSALVKRCASTDTNTTGTMQEIFRFYAHYQERQTLLFRFPFQRINDFLSFFLSFVSENSKKPKALLQKFFV